MSGQSVGSKVSKEGAKRSKKDKIDKIRHYIHNERDSITLKWKSLEESLESEDNRRAQFVRRRIKEDSIILPLIIRKFIGSLRKAVRSTMRIKGGTPYSIVHNLFIYWDSKKTGNLSSLDLENAMNSLGIRVTESERQAIVEYYDSGHGNSEMSYVQLLEDLQRGEPSVIEFVEKEEDIGMRFEEMADDFIEMPDTVKRFLEAFRSYIDLKMAKLGGTPVEHVRAVFEYYDTDLTSGLGHDQLLRAARQGLKLNMSPDQATTILRYYDRHYRNEVNYNTFVTDVCTKVKSILQFTELSARTIRAGKRKLLANPFTVKPFKAIPNKVLEIFKQDALNVLDAKVSALGGSKREWLKEAFRNWDPRNLGVVSRWQDLQGAAKRLGLSLSEENAKCLMRTYDNGGRGEANYYLMILDMSESDPHFLTDATIIDSQAHTNLAATVTSRTPSSVVKGIDRFKRAADAYCRKSGGLVEPRDILHGTCLRFDKNMQGRINIAGVRGVCSELGIQLEERDIEILVNWFDTDGTTCLDYNELTKQLYGEDIMTKMLRLPSLPADSKVKLLASASSTKPSSYGLGTSSISTMAVGMGGARDNAGGAKRFAGWESKPSRSGVGDLESGLLSMKTLERNMQVIDNKILRDAKKAARRQLILEEKVEVQLKLASIENQRRKILADHKSSKNTK